MDDQLTNAVSPVTYVGSYVADGHLFLVFDNGLTSGQAIYSPTAPVTSFGYPTNFVSDPPPVLNTGALALCFGEGTLISAPNGERRVEELCIGDLVSTASGETAGVFWLGRQTVYPALFGNRIAPVRIRAGALGQGLPHSDLTVTADHGMVVDGYVINASALVNGDTIDYVPMSELAEPFTVYHIETEHHNVILANGVASETFIDVAGREAFDNYQDYLDLYGVERIRPETAMPRISSARLVSQRIKARLKIGCDGTAAAIHA